MKGKKILERLSCYKHAAEDSVSFSHSSVSMQLTLFPRFPIKLQFFSHRGYFSLENWYWPSS